MQLTSFNFDCHTTKLVNKQQRITH